MGKYLKLLKKSTADRESNIAAPLGDVPSAEEALALLHRVRAYSLPAGRIPVVCELAKRLRGLDAPEAIRDGLRAFESELIAAGGKYDPAIADAVSLITGALPGTALIAVRSIKQ